MQRHRVNVPIPKGRYRDTERINGTKARLKSSRININPVA
jgi:hypothetical protein